MEFQYYNSFILCFCSALLYVAYYIFKTTQNVKDFTKHGIPYMGNFVINVIGMLWRRESLTEYITNDYKFVKQTKQKFGIQLEFGKPAFFITDLELIKQITIKHFEHFTELHRFDKSMRKDDLLGRSLVSLSGNQWKETRSKIGPAYSNAKTKRLFHIMNSSGEKLVNYFRIQIAKGEQVINTEEGLSKYALDFISLASFGLEAQVFEGPSPFTQMAVKARLIITRMVIQTILAAIHPFLPGFFGFSLVDFKIQKYFHNIIVNTVKLRQEKQLEKKNDFIDILLEIWDPELKLTPNNNKNKENTPGISSAEGSLEISHISSQGLTFLIAGYDSVRNALEFAVYNLAVWPEVQERLFQELKKAVKENGGVLSYEVIHGLEYLHGVISESQRMFPNAPATTRICTKDFNIPGTPMVISKGSAVLIPIAPIQNDPDYFPNPDKFDPERFSAENRDKILPSSYLPFGQGPRGCIGWRLALMKLKTALAHLFLNFVLEPCHQTELPIKLASNCINLKPKNGVWLKFKLRNWRNE